MPGLFGWLDFGSDVAGASTAEAMALSMAHQPKLLVETSAIESFVAGRVHLGYVQSGQQPVFSKDNRYVLWLDGEFSNRDELCSAYGLPKQSVSSDAAFAIALCERVGWQYLSRVEGIFVIALFNRADQELTLASD